MKLQHTLLFATVISTFGLLIKISPASAEQWYFFVKNDTRTSINELLVSQDKQTWGYFDIGAGIPAGETIRLVWDESTNNESCTQWIKAKFRDGAESGASQINFCKDLDDPIVFD